MTRRFKNVIADPTYAAEVDAASALLDRLYPVLKGASPSVTLHALSHLLLSSCVQFGFSRAQLLEHITAAFEIHAEDQARRDLLVENPP